MCEKVLITTYPFQYANRLDGICEYKENPCKRKLTKDELRVILKDFQPTIIIAGTEKYTARELDLVPNLKMISRVGIGVDSIDFVECNKRNIIVTNTPNAPSNAVAELTIAQMINALRHVKDVELRNKPWCRYVGRELRNSTVGIIGMGRIGSLVYQRLLGFECNDILVNDIDESKCAGKHTASKEEIFFKCNIITLHIPLNEDNRDYISEIELMGMSDKILINMSRGGIINEDALYNWLKINENSYAVIDTFDEEPYNGSLYELDNTILTPHLGSCSKTSRYHMENDAIDEVLHFINNENFKSRLYE